MMTTKLSKLPIISFVIASFFGANVLFAGQAGTLNMSPSQLEDIIAKATEAAVARALAEVKAQAGQAVQAPATTASTTVQPTAQQVTQQKPVALSRFGATA